MCEKCKLAVDWLYPKLSDADKCHLLMSATCFPFGTPERVAEQLLDHIENTDGSMQAAINRAHEQLDAAMAAIPREP
jgi:hypothetical protein